MAVSNFLAIPLLSTSQVGKEQTINTMVQYLERAMNDSVTIDFLAGNFSLPQADFFRYQYFKVTNAGPTSTLTLPQKKRMFVIDNLSNGNALQLSCTSDTLTIPATAICTVLCDGVNLISVTDSTVMGGGGGVTTFTGLNDVPGNYGGSSLYLVRVKADMSGLEFVQASTALLTDVATADLQDGDVLTWVAADGKFKNIAGSGAGGSTTLSWRSSVSVATIGPISIADDLVAGALVDTITLAPGNRILVWQQAIQSENGIYVINDDGDPERAADATTAAQLAAGTTTIVLGGTYARQLFMQTAEVALVGTSPIVWQKQAAGALGELSNVDLTGLTDGRFLKWDQTLGKWVAGTFTASGLPTGGATGEALIKQSGTDGDVAWGRILPDPTGNAGKNLAVNAAGNGYELVSGRLRKTSETAFSPVLTDANGIVATEAATPVTITIPLAATVAFSPGVPLTFIQAGAGPITLAGAAGVTINQPPGHTLVSAGQWSTIALANLGGDVWVATGQLEAA